MPLTMGVRDHHDGRAVVCRSDHGVLDVSEHGTRCETVEDLVVETHSCAAGQRGHHDSRSPDQIASHDAIGADVEAGLLSNSSTIPMASSVVLPNGRQCRRNIRCVHLPC